jgi:hypothetical protein
VTTGQVARRGAEQGPPVSGKRPPWRAACRRDSHLTLESCRGRASSRSYEGEQGKKNGGQGRPYFVTACDYLQTSNSLFDGCTRSRRARPARPSASPNVLDFTVSDPAVTRFLDRKRASRSLSDPQQTPTSTLVVYRGVVEHRAYRPVARATDRQPTRARTRARQHDPEILQTRLPPFEKLLSGNAPARWRRLNQRYDGTCSKKFQLIQLCRCHLPGASRFVDGKSEGPLYETDPDARPPFFPSCVGATPRKEYKAPGRYSPRVVESRIPPCSLPDTSFTPAAFTDVFQARAAWHSSCTRSGTR